MFSIHHRSAIDKRFILLNVIYSRSRETVNAKDREIASLRRQIDSTSEELTEVGRGREVALRENRRLQDDLNTMTRENQVCVCVCVCVCV